LATKNSWNEAGFYSNFTLYEATLAAMTSPFHFSPSLIDGSYYISSEMVNRSPTEEASSHASYLGWKNVRTVSVGSINELKEMLAFDSLYEWNEKLSEDSPIPYLAHSTDYST
jgi:hypothetical protein